jgi:hypothetical protein
MFGDWFNVKEVDEFADSIVADLVKRIPPAKVEAQQHATGKKAAEKLRKAHDAIFKRIEVFARTHSLNVYKKARLGNRIKWALAEAGYPSALVDTLTVEILTVVAHASRARTQTASRS